MRDYSKVSGQFWTGKTGKALRGDPAAQILALYLMSSPHSNMIGVFHCPILYMAHETGLPLEGASKALQRLIEVGFCAFDGDAEIVWVCEMAAHQIGERLHAKDKQCAGAQKQYEKISEAHIRRGFYDRYREDFHLKNMDGNPSPFEAPSKPLPSQEQEQEQEQDKKETPLVISDADDSCRSASENQTSSEDQASSEILTPVEVKTSSENQIPDCPQQKILSLFAEILPELPQPRIWEGARQTALRARWRWVIADLRAHGKPHGEADGIDFFRRMFAYIAKSDFLCGRTASWAGADLGWIVKADNFAKILQGNYENREAA